jgi:predicted ABC-type ATPase
MSPRRSPQIVVIAGPNGAGKTSSAADLLRDTVGIEVFVNADVIAQGLAGFRPELAAFEAGRIVLERIDELGRARADFAVESTLSGLTLARRLERLAAAGYVVHVVYLWLPSPDLAVARVRQRVEAGGHHVPEADVRRRFWRSLVNFDRVYRPLAASWRIYDGSAHGLRPLIAYGSGRTQASSVDPAKWDSILRQVERRA